MALTLQSLADEVRPTLNGIGLIHDLSLARIAVVAEALVRANVVDQALEAAA